MIHLVQPCRGHITQWHGNKQSHNGLPHGGQDYAYYSGGKVTDEVFAAADGVVVYAGDARALGWPNQWYYNPDFNRNDNVDQSAGNVVTIRHNQNGVKFDTTYNHLAAWSVKAGQPVRAGQRIATIGDTGFSAGKHLHFELLFHPFNFGTPTYGRADPNPYFSSAAIATQGTITPAAQAAPEQPKEWDEMASKDDIKEAIREVTKEGYGIVDSVWYRPVGGWNGHVSAEARLAGTDQAVNDIRAQLGAQNGMIAGLIGALAAVNKGEPFDQDKLLAGVKSAAESGVKDAIESITVTVKGN